LQPQPVSGSLEDRARICARIDQNAHFLTVDRTFDEGQSAYHPNRPFGDERELALGAEHRERSPCEQKKSGGL
jgi:hypothetical protein